MLKDYLRVAKPWIVFANVLSAAGGFFLAAQGRIDVGLFLAVLVGISAVVASGCVCNNYIDRDIDALMARTATRPLARQSISTVGSLLYALILGVIGLAILGLGTNLLTLAIVVAGFAVYVGVYSLVMKRTSAYSTVVGSLAGAAPPLAAYCAVTGRLDLGGLIVLAIFSLWQIPHSYAITIYRFKDYAAASLPVMPVRHGVAATKKDMVVHIIAFTLAAQLLTVCGYAGYAYSGVVAMLSLYWLTVAWTGPKLQTELLWARKLYILSILTIVVVSVMMSVDYTATVPLP
ncbi:heme o synthase [Desulfovibrio sp. TomC]|uniref:heme o synthase n=1 Tax=Desulfovibrio sp. TomC TaxID=1562888 RepID=UPI000575E0B7|nr:heme o synthase [Desulfovibrio sp. TomC]KHK03388.1 Heme O synthase, protoheme IX farnesyltransferase [Desulfovibrio sp. TomC]